MGKPLSMDPRERVIKAIDGSMSRRGAAKRYGIAPSTAIRWDNARRKIGSFAPKQQGGDMRSQRIEADADVIHSALEETPEIMLAELWTICRRGASSPRPRRCGSSSGAMGSH